MPGADAFDRFIALQRGHLLVWVPVCLALGIGLYFALPHEPSRMTLAGAAGAACLVCLLARRAGETAAPPLAAVALVLAGLALAGHRAHLQAAPVLEYRYYGAIEGRVIGIDRSLSDKVRLTLDRVVLERMDPDRTPIRVRVTLHGPDGAPRIVAGDRVILTGHLGPPRGPVEPGGFDFQRQAWFKSLGAVGYSRTPVLRFAAHDPGELDVALTRFRLWLADTIRAGLSGQAGAFAAAVLTGDRSALSRDTLDTMRATNLAHLLAISGLHVGLLTGVVFAAVRVGLALVPGLALRLPGKKIAAAVALVGAAVYLALSGGSVSTQRAFIMVAVMLVAVLLDRRALTLRSVAIAATIVLVLRPESLLGPGFQMSFAATTALVWVFGLMRDGKLGDLHRGGPLRRWAVALFVSSAVAGLATSPVGLAHFNQGSSFGLPANLLAVPLMGSLVIPAALVALLLAPLGLGGLGLWAMGLGVEAILSIARLFADLPGAVWTAPQPPGWVLPVFALGALWVILLQGRLRAAGVVPMLAAALAWTNVPRPDVLIADSGALIGVMSPAGRVLSKPRGDGFAARSWLENDGDPAGQAEAHARSGADNDIALMAEVAGLRLRQLSVRGYKKTDAPCTGVDLLVLNRAPDHAPDCPVLGPGMLSRSGAVALFADRRGRLRVETVRDGVGLRLWTARGVRAAQSDFAGAARAADISQRPGDFPTSAEVRSVIARAVVAARAAQ